MDRTVRPRLKRGLTRAPEPARTTESTTCWRSTAGWWRGGRGRMGEERLIYTEAGEEKHPQMFLIVLRLSFDESTHPLLNPPPTRSHPPPVTQSPPPPLSTPHRHTPPPQTTPLRQWEKPVRWVWAVTSAPSAGTTWRLERRQNLKVNCMMAVAIGCAAGPYLHTC